MKTRKQKIPLGEQMIQNTLDELQKNAENTKKSIQTHIAQLHRELDNRERELLKEVDEYWNRKKNDLDKQLKEIRSFDDAIFTSVQYAEELLAKGNPVEIMANRTMLLNRLDELNGKVIELENPIQNPFIEFNEGETRDALVAHIMQFGIIDPKIQGQMVFLFLSSFYFSFSI